MQGLVLRSACSSEARASSSSRSIGSQASGSEELLAELSASFNAVRPLYTASKGKSNAHFFPVRQMLPTCALDRSRLYKHANNSWKHAKDNEWYERSLKNNR